MRFPLEIIGIVREAFPADKPVFVRVSAVDRVDNGWTMDDTVAFARELRAIGVDVMDCSSGGNAPMNLMQYAPGYQVPFAERVRRETGLKTMAVGLITEPQQAEDIIALGRADLVAIAREALANPQWPLHAARALGVQPEDFSNWPLQARWVLAGRERLRRM
jgi:2,4-dienoyl-CoA reductase-like NADH-dependent reductase (Old Yellow Enzyme family)